MKRLIVRGMVAKLFHDEAGFNQQVKGLPPHFLIFLFSLFSLGTSSQFPLFLFSLFSLGTSSQFPLFLFSLFPQRR